MEQRHTFTNALTHCCVDSECVHAEAEQHDRPRRETRVRRGYRRVCMSQKPGALDAKAFKHLLVEYQLFPDRTHTGSVFFDATRVAAGVAAHSGHDLPTALEVLARWAASVGGEVDEGGPLRLPAQRFGDDW